MGEKKLETSGTSTTSIAPKSASEQNLSQLFEQLATQAGLQLEKGPGVNAQDRQLAEDSISASGDITRRQIEEMVREMNLGLDESLSARGIQGSSRESVERGIVGREGVRQFSNTMDAERRDMANMLPQLALQRNQQLLQQLGLGQFVMNMGLQERLASGTTETTGDQTTSGTTWAEQSTIAKDGGQAAVELWGGGESTTGG